MHDAIVAFTLRVIASWCNMERQLQCALLPILQRDNTNTSVGNLVGESGARRYLSIYGEGPIVGVLCLLSSAWVSAHGTETRRECFINTCQRKSPPLYATPLLDCPAMPRFIPFIRRRGGVLAGGCTIWLLKRASHTSQPAYLRAFHYEPSTFRSAKINAPRHVTASVV